MPLPVKHMIAALEKKGFRKNTSRADHLEYIFYFRGARTMIKTHFSHGAREYHDGLVAAVAKQVYLPKKQFVRLVDCSLSEQGYIQHLANTGHPAVS